MKFLIALIILTYSFFINAGELEKKELIYSNLMDDIIACSTYYSISAEGLKRAKNPEAEAIMNLSNRFGIMALNVAKEINLKEETIQSKFKLHSNNQLKILDYDYKNLSLLILEYNEKCVSWLSDEFQSRLIFWTEDYLKRFGE